MPGDQAKSSPIVKPRVRKQFTHGEESIIIEHYHQNRFLWDPTHENYKIAVKSDSLQTLRTQLNNKFTAQEIHSRFSGMRTTYRQNKAKVSATRVTGIGADDVYKPSWIHFESLMFLDDEVPDRRSISSYCTQNYDSNVYVDSESTTADDVLTSTDNRSQKQISKAAAKKIKEKKESEMIDECLGVLRSVKNSETEKSKDRCDCFGEYVTESLKQMQLWHQTCAMNKISTVLMAYDPSNPNQSHGSFNPSQLHHPNNRSHRSDHGQSQGSYKPPSQSHRPNNPTHPNDHGQSQGSYKPPSQSHRPNNPTHLDDAGQSYSLNHLDHFSPGDDSRQSFESYDQEFYQVEMIDEGESSE